MSAGGSIHSNDLEMTMSSLLSIGPREAWAILSPYRDLYNRGKITEDDIWTGIEKRTGIAVPSEKRAIWSTWETNASAPEMVGLCERLRSKGITVGLMSNVVPYTAQDIRSHKGYDVFDFTVLSSEVGYAKPDPQIYDIALSLLKGIPTDEILFVDDQERFLVPAHERGIQTVLAESIPRVVHDVETRTGLA